MAKSTLEKLNEQKEKELEKREHYPEKSEGETGNDSPTSVVDNIEDFTTSPADKARKHKGPIGLDKEPGV